MKRSWRTRLRSHSMRDGKCHADHLDALEEKLPASVGADVIAAYQYGRVYQQRRILPEKRLMLAILADARAEYRKYARARDRRGKKRFRDIAAWILDDDTGWLFSFENICELLGLEPDCLRWGLRRCKQAKLQRVLTRSAA